MTTQTFVYREKFSWGFLFPAAIGLVGIVYAITNPFHIRFKNLTVLAYPNSKYAVLGIGLVFILYAVHKYLKMKAVNAADHTIVVSGNDIHFKQLNGYTLSGEQVDLASVSELWNNTDDDGESMIIYTAERQNRYEFFAGNFASASDFAAFKKIMETGCNNITNRN